MTRIDIFYPDHPQLFRMPTLPDRNLAAAYKRILFILSIHVKSPETA